MVRECPGFVCSRHFRTGGDTDVPLTASPWAEEAGQDTRRARDKRCAVTDETEAAELVDRSGPADLDHPGGRAAGARAERVRRISQARLAAVFHGLPIGLIVTDRAGRILEINEECQRILGMPGTPGASGAAGASRAVRMSPRAGRGRRGLVSRRLTDLVHPDDRATLERLWEQVTDAPLSTECRLRRSDGSSLWVELTLSRSRAAAGSWFVLATVADITERRRLQARVQFHALHDPLTGLPNRALLHQHLKAAFSPSSGVARVGLCSLDLDWFKLVNDGYGQAVADRLLVEVAQRLRRMLDIPDVLGVPGLPESAERPEALEALGVPGASGTAAASGVAALPGPPPPVGTSPSGRLLARTGGDEFVIMVSGSRGIAEMARIARCVQDALRDPVRIDGHDLPVTCSTGVVEAAVAETTDRALVCAAETALSWAKAGGKNCWMVFDPDRGALEVTRGMLARSMAPGLERDEFTVVYQPIVDLASGAIAGAEALVRWDHPERGRQRTADFIALAEESGFIVRLGLWVLEHACAAAARWPDETFVSVNLSARQLQEPGLAADVAAVLARTGLPASRLQLELTETVLMAPRGQAADNLWALADLGARVVLDDFGTGWSNLAYLCSTPVRGLKLPAPLVDAIDSTPEFELGGRGGGGNGGRGNAGGAGSTGIPGARVGRERPRGALSQREVVRGLVTFAHNLGLSVTVEGIERAGQEAALREMGGILGQGHLLGVAMSEADFAARLPHPARP